MMRLEGLSETEKKNSMTSSGLEQATFATLYASTLWYIPERNRIYDTRAWQFEIVINN
jgi:hypothetical protein